MNPIRNLAAAQGNKNDTASRKLYEVQDKQNKAADGVRYVCFPEPETVDILQSTSRDGMRDATSSDRSALMTSGCWKKERKGKKQTYINR